MQYVSFDGKSNSDALLAYKLAQKFM